MMAVIVSLDGELLSPIGHNDTKNDIHAEENAWEMWTRQERYTKEQKVIMVVVRTRRDGNGLFSCQSKPCRDCALWIKENDQIVSTVYWEKFSNGVNPWHGTFLINHDIDVSTCRKSIGRREGGIHYRRSRPLSNIGA